MPRTSKSRYISTNPKPQFYLAGIRDADRFADMVKASKRLWPLRVQIEARVKYYNRIARKLQRESAVATLATPLFITSLGVGIQVEAANPRSSPLLDKSTSLEAPPDEAPPDEAPPEEFAAEESAAEESAVEEAPPE